MEEGNYIHLEDNFGPVNGKIIQVLSHDVIEVQLITSSYDGKWSKPEALEKLTFLLTNVKVINNYETFEELISNHFEEFL